MDSTSFNQLLPYLLPVLVLVLIVRRGMRQRKLQAERLWVMPALLLFLGGSTLVAAPPKTTTGIAIVAAALLVGAAIGWWRGRLTQITIDPETHELSSKTSPVGVILIAAIFVARYGLRLLALHNPGMLPGGAGLIADALMIFAIGMIAVQRLEMWLRCQRLIADGERAAKKGS